MKPGQRGKSIYITDTRCGRRRLLPFEQKTWFWPTIMTMAFLLTAAAILQVTGWENSSSYLAAMITGSFALALCSAIRRSRLEHFKMMRAANRAQRVEREMERFIIKMLRGLRLPIKSIKDLSKEIGKLCKQVHDQIGDIPLPDETRNIIVQPHGGQIFQDAKSIWKSAIDLDTIPQGLLQLGRIRKTHPDIAWIDTHAIAIDILHSMQALIDETDAKIKIKQLPPCLADKDLLQQILRAIISNALQNTANDRDPVIRVWGFTEKDHVIYCIEDNGIGIADDQLEKIFEIFYRVDPAASNAGVGLAVVRRAVERQRGRLWVKSTPNQGSTFSFSLPTK